MSKLKVVIVSGNLGTPSKSLALAKQIVDAIQREAAIELQVHQLVELAGEFGPARHPGELGEEGLRVLQSIRSVDLLIAVTPVYKGSYTGLFKHLFDFIDPVALNETPVILGATGGGDKHALIIEHQLRPLFGFFGAFTVPAGVYASEQSFDGTRFTDPVVLERINAAARQGVDLAFSRQRQQPAAKAA